MLQHENQQNATSNSQLLSATSLVDIRKIIAYCNTKKSSLIATPNIHVTQHANFVAST
jgi:hypothetical protein